MKLKVTSGSVPAGSYLTKFVGVESVTNDYGPGLEWRWEIVSGPCAGQLTKRTTSDQPTVRNICGQILAGLKGKPLTADEDIDLAEFIGKTYLAVVVETPNGKSKVNSVTPAPVA